jgi:formate-dependent nitrite reductase membrane component NrfD
MARRPRTSWISRGVLSTGVFILAGLLFLIPSYVSAAPWDTWGIFGIVMLVISLLGMGGVLLSSGFVYAAARPVALWNSPLQPLSSIAVGVRSGAALALVCLPFVDFSSGEWSVQTWWLAATAALIFLVILEIGAARSDATVAWSLRVSRSGRNAWLFFVGWLLLGVLLPATLVILSYAASLAATGFVVAGVASLIGDFAFRYDMNLAGFFVPLVSPSQGERGRYGGAAHAPASRGLGHM